MKNEEKDSISSTNTTSWITQRWRSYFVSFDTKTERVEYMGRESSKRFNIDDVLTSKDSTIRLVEVGKDGNFE